MLLSRLFTIFHHGADAVPIFMSQLKIREMPEDERPREKLLAHGPDSLTNAELIAILLRTGRRGMNVVEVARELLDRYKSFAELSRCSVKELSEIKGIGQAKALELVAAFNLGKRFAQEPLSQQKLDSPELIHELLGRELRMLRTESLRVVLLDTRYRLMRVESVSTGSMNESIAHRRAIGRKPRIFQFQGGRSSVTMPCRNRLCPCSRGEDEGEGFERIRTGS